jgi:predicted PurR-regulated permease PerM
VPTNRIETALVAQAVEASPHRDPPMRESGGTLKKAMVHGPVRVFLAQDQCLTTSPLPCGGDPAKICDSMLCIEHSYVCKSPNSSLRVLAVLECACDQGWRCKERRKAAIATTAIGIEPDMTDHDQARQQFRRIFVLLLVLVVSIVFIATVKGFLITLFLAAVFTGMVYPLYGWLLEHFRGRASVASVTTLALVFCAVVMPLIVFFGVVAGQAVEVTQIVAPWVERHLENSAAGSHSLPDWIPFREHLTPYHEQITSKLAEFASKAGRYLVGSLLNITQITGVFLLNLFIMLYAMFFFLIGGPKIVKTVMGYLPLPDSDKETILHVGLSVSKATIKGTLVIGIVQGALGGIGLAVVGIPGAAFWGTIMVVLSIIPGIGTALVWVPAVIFLVISDSAVAATGLLIWNVAVVGMVDNVVRPRLVGKDAKMPDLLILISTLGGLGLFGALGLVIGPVIAALFMTAWTIFGHIFEDELSDA